MTYAESVAFHWTWGELKAPVEQAGATDDTLIWYIDISHNDFTDSIGATVENGELAVQ